MQFLISAVVAFGNGPHQLHQTEKYRRGSLFPSFQFLRPSGCLALLQPVEAITDNEREHDYQQCFGLYLSIQQISDIGWQEGERGLKVLIVFEVLCFQCCHVQRRQPSVFWFRGFSSKVDIADWSLLSFP